VAVDRIDDASQHRGQRIAAEGMEEIRDRDIVGHPEIGCIGYHDLNISASMLMSSRR